VLGADNDTVSDSGGIDTVTSTITRSIAALATIENLALLGAGNINATGNALANILTGNAGHNTLNGAAGADTLNGGLGNDTYVLGAESDSVADTGGVDTITSTVTRNLASFAVIERLFLVGGVNINGAGNGLDNTIVGNSGANTLSGGAGLDTLTGGLGRDVLSGEAGNDVFDFNSVAETGVNVSTRDVIRDFAKGQDRIDLSTIDANGSVAGDPAFLFRGTSAFSAAGQIRFVQIDSANNAQDQTIVEGNIDSNLAADFQIQLTGLVNLAATDFVL
jgi:serralysin